jgi:hypothetical protein
MARHVMALIEHESGPEAHDNLPTSLIQRESA